jgi:putative flavoprotein involved in K+ transport
VTPVPGLYFLGLHWMHSFRSGLLPGVTDDAAVLAERIAAT